MSGDWAFTLSSGRPEAGMRLRTLTAGVPLLHARDFAAIDRAAEMLLAARSRFGDAGYEVQSLRVVTVPLKELPGADIPALAALEEHAGGHGLLLGTGPLAPGPDTVRFAVDLVAATRTLCTSLALVRGDKVDAEAVALAGEIVAGVAKATVNGEGAFRFAASALVPAGTPFFPAGWHSGSETTLSIGIEAPWLVADAIRGRTLAGAPDAIRHALDSALAPVARIAREAVGDRFLGIDTSPAPMLEASIGAAVETLSGVPFGTPGTLAACAAITAGLTPPSIPRCGYSGLMLPVLEDRVLAARAAQGRFGIAELLLYSSVCGTGLDTLALAGDTPAHILSSIMGDLAALALRHRKPLAARLLPVPGRRAGDRVSFETPFLTDSVVLAPERGQE